MLPQQMAMSWTVRGSNPGDGKILFTVQSGPESYLTSCTMSTGSFPGVKQWGLGIDRLPPSSTKL